MIKQIEKSASKSPGPSPGLLPTPNMPPVSPYSLERPVLSGAPANLNKPNSSLLNKVVTGPAGTVIQTTDPRLTAMGLPQYPPLPANIDPSKIDEIRRTVYVGNLDSAGGVTAEALLQVPPIFPDIYELSVRSTVRLSSVFLRAHLLTISTT